MIIHRMTASFGALKNRTLELSPGLNVIEAPNESGKTTWCVFARTMLYGPDGRRSREGKRLEKLYAPWDGSAMYGEMELGWAGKEITLRRSEGPAGPMRSMQAVYTGTNVPVSGLEEADAGETLTGMTSDVFARTAYIGPAGLGIDRSTELDRKIAALVSTGEEGVTFSRAAEQLRTLQRRCRYHSKGLLPGLEQEMEKLTADEEQRRSIAARLEETQLREEALKKELEETSGRKERERVYLAARQRAMDLESRLLDREREAVRLDGELRRGPLRGREPGEAEYKAMRSDHRRALELEKAREREPQGSGLWVAALLLAALLAAGGAFVRWLLIGAAAALAGAMWLFFRQRNGRSEAPDRELDRLLKKNGAHSAGEIPRRYEKYASLWRESRAVRRDVEELRGQVKTAREEVQMPAQGEGSGAADTDREDELRRVIENGARLRGQLEAMGDPAALRSRYECLREEHARLEGKYAALEMALRELTAADEEMHLRFSPALSRSAGEIFRRLTGGRYDSLAFDRELTASVRAADGTLPREEEYLSRGTRDQLYLSLRLALCELTAGADPCPVILDDALLTFDDERLGYAMEFLRELSRRRQIILFTCQSREKSVLKRGKGA